jgi:Rad/Gem-related GTP binding protein 1
VSSGITNAFSCHVTDDEFGEKAVCVLLDGEESELTFVDHPSSEMSVSISLSETQELSVTGVSTIHRTLRPRVKTAMV